MIKISRDFSETPGGRTAKEGEFSGEEFRDNYLEPAYERCVSIGERLVIDFDDCYGFGTSFLEEAFGGLVRKRREKGILNHLELIANDDEIIIRRITEFIKAAEKEI